MNRVVDVLVAGTGLVLTSPILGLAALGTKLDGGAPVLYRSIHTVSRKKLSNIATML